MTKVQCPKCKRDVAQAAINASIGICGRCYQSVRDLERGYSIVGNLRKDIGDCYFCGATCGSTIGIEVVVDGELHPSNLDCILARRDEFPEAAALVSVYVGELNEYHRQQDTREEENEDD